MQISYQDPTGRRILILPFSIVSITKGGIHLAKQTVDKERLATYFIWLRRSPRDMTHISCE